MKNMNARKDTGSVGDKAMQGDGMYYRLLAMIVVSFVLMYALMYAMVDRLANVFANVNQFYMAGLMAMPMLILELAIMGGMYRRKSWNMALIGFSLIALTGFWIGIRQQVAVSDEQFLKSMIPHHASAILMCNEASLTDPDILALCHSIVTGQQAEIAQMKQILARKAGRAQ